jgi:hypothetical protein
MKDIELEMLGVHYATMIEPTADGLITRDVADLDQAAAGARHVADVKHLALFDWRRRLTEKGSAPD